MSGAAIPGPAAAAVRAEPAAPLHLMELGTVPYRDAWTLQQRLVTQRTEGRIGDTVLLVEHPPVFTLGRRATEEHVLLDAGQRAAQGIDLVAVDRGGDVTYHGPGQLVVYPVLRLAGSRHVVDFVRALEQVAVEALARLGVTGTCREGLTGVWVGRDKLVAIGVRVGVGGITSHGFALNVDPDLTHFNGIIPCGLATEGVTSLSALGRPADMTAAREAVRSALTAVLATDILDVDPDGASAHTAPLAEEPLR